MENELHAESKSTPQSFRHNFVKYRPFFISKYFHSFHWHTVQEICNKVVIKDLTTLQMRSSALPCEILMSEN